VTAFTAVIASRRDDGDWRDLDLAVRSLRHYSTVPIVVAWQGPAAPDIPADLLVEQPDSCATFGAAYQFAAGLTDSPLLLVCNDDIVACPDSVDLLVTDYQVAADVGPVGFVAASANYARPSQQRLRPLERPKPARVVSPFFAVVERAALPERWPDCNWYSDDIMCVDMAAAGRTHWLSRAIVHHIGERSTGRDHGALDRDGRKWVLEHRPDLAGVVC